jgi:hypothetical protein
LFWGLGLVCFSRGRSATLRRERKRLAIDAARLRLPSGSRRAPSYPTGSSRKTSSLWKRPVKSIAQFRSVSSNFGSGTLPDRDIAPFDGFRVWHHPV